ncbi:MAG: iron-only hydrogenase system regulator [Clostridia bacterium]|nr:iron-only hydrogenase system regulator [Clostridia bacterium]
METRVAVISIVVEKSGCIEKLNALLHEYGDYILGRMGIPYKVKNINLISVAIDAPQDVINTLTGSLGKLDGITAKAAYSKM